MTDENLAANGGIWVHVELSSHFLVVKPLEDWEQVKLKSHMPFNPEYFE